MPILLDTFRQADVTNASCVPDIKFVSKSVPPSELHLVPEGYKRGMSDMFMLSNTMSGLTNLQNPDALDNVVAARDRTRQNNNHRVRKLL